MANNQYIHASFPSTRMRRNRLKDWSRRLIREHNLTVNDLIWPIFITANKKTEITSMPGVYRIPLSEIVKQAKQAENIGIPAIALFPETDPKLKDDNGTEALNNNNLVCEATRIIKDKCNSIGIITDVALDPYTSHGHDGIMDKHEILNDETLEILGQQAINQATAGADIIAPSDMMDGRVQHIRKILDINNFKNIQIMSYAAKYASNFYGPFRNAIGSDNNLSKKSKKSYQMDYANSNEAIKEVQLDISEGADMVMIKPGMPYLDIIYKIKSEFKIPTYAYQVSGEYSMIKNAIINNYLSENTIIESLTCFKRAGADGILSYFALEAAKILNDEK